MFRTVPCILAVAFVAMVLAQDFSYDVNGVPLCPVRDDTEGNATIVPDPFNCTTFYICSNGVAHRMQCPDELQFSTNLTVCDWEESVLCELVEVGAEDGQETVRVRTV